MTRANPAHDRVRGSRVFERMPVVFRVRFVLAVALLACIGCDRFTRTGSRGQAGDVVRRIVVLGDSLSVAPTIAESFPSLLQKRLLESGSPATVINAGVRGDTTAGGLRRIDALLAQKPGLLILALGANDGLRGIDVDTMSRNLGEMIARARREGVQVLLCGMELPPVRGMPYARAFRMVFPETARTFDIPLVPFLLEGVAFNPAMNGTDQIHPNAAGARKIADTVWPYLEPLVR
jgi:acyl-CoA thioesterase-1